jgi:hypothetical protein
MIWMDLDRMSCHDHGVNAVVLEEPAQAQCDRKLGGGKDVNGDALHALSRSKWM